MSDFQFQPPLCEQHHIPMVWRDDADYVYDDEGVQVVVRHIQAFVCPQGDDQAFAPGVAKELYPIVRELVATAKRARAAHAARATPLEYLVTA
ncbi:MAG: hypothetical protein HY784_08505 [Chloroflexi bacterium]|nr:hypothetical protein [Chloroflexota bacterium]